MSGKLIPLIYADELRCIHCSRFLSCGPVRALNDTGSSCGRCEQFSPKHFHNYAFETLAVFFKFPCVHWENYCPASLDWNESLKHEDSCSYTGCLSFFCSHPSACCSNPRSLEDKTRNLPLIQLYDEEIKKLVCLSCGKPLSCSPVYITLEGYDVCHRCADRRNPDDSRRNIVYEKIASLFVFPCAYKSKGCPQKLRFGGETYQHEESCTYARPPRLQEVNGKPQKERGVIKTHTGHIFATITQHHPAFAPPQSVPTGGFDVNRQIVKSLQKKHHKQRGAIDGSFHWEDTSETSSDGRMTPKNDENILNARDLDKQFQKQGGYPNPGYQPDQRDHKYPGGYPNQAYQPDYPRYSNQGYPVDYYRPLQHSSSNISHNKWRPEQNNIPMSHSFNQGRSSQLPPLPNPKPHNIPRRVSSRKEKPAYLDELVNRHRVGRTGSNAKNVPNPYQECNNLNDLRQAHTRLGVPAGYYS